MKKLLKMFINDRDAVSIGRLCAVLAFMLFCGISLYLAILCKTWGNYEAFSVACVVYMLVQLGNKAVETRLFKIRGDEQ